MARLRPLVALALALTLAACALACRRADTRGDTSGSAAPSPPSVGDAAPLGDEPHVARPAFGLYVLALSWAPSFCCTHPDKEECEKLGSAFAGTHLTLHGLWPNFTDAEARGNATYPQFCGAFARCKTEHDARCLPDPTTLPDEMRTLGPGYVGDHDFLADHEWPKHGSCTGLTPAAYFRAALDAMKKLPGSGTPEALRGAIGGDVALADLERAFGVPRDSVLLSCDAQCRLEQVSFCLAHDAKGLPTTALTCPANTTKAQYDNGCVTRGCERVIVSQAGVCDRGGKRPKGGPNKDPSGGGGRCNHPGQGPPCAGNDECVKAGFLRCARSGCCTSQP